MNQFNLINSTKFTTPLLTFQYPKLLEPDTKFSPDGRYECQGYCPVDQGATLADQLDKFLEEHKASLKAQSPTTKFKLTDLPWGYNETNGRPTFFVKTKCKASGIDREGKAWSRKPVLFDAQGSVVQDRSTLDGMWSGTTGRISFIASPFYTAAIGAGITLRLLAVQIIELKSQGGNGTDHGFSAEEGWTPSASKKAETIPYNGEASVEFDPLDF